MKGNKEYVIRFSELKADTETFEFVLEDSFFKKFESSEYETGSIHALVHARKRTDGITLDMNLNGSLKVVCDRCLELFDQDIDATYTLFIKFGAEEEEIDDNILVIPKEENRVELGELFYEYLILSLPIQRIHPDDKDGNSTCNSSMIEKLENHIVDEEEKGTDPRWDELKKLMDKN